MWMFIRWALWSPLSDLFKGFNHQHTFMEFQSLILSFHKCHVIWCLWYSQLRTRLKLLSPLYGRKGLERGNNLHGVMQVIRWEPSREPRALDSQPKMPPSFVWDVLLLTGPWATHPLLASSRPGWGLRELSGLSELSCKYWRGFSYPRVTSHSSSCQQPKYPSTCRL